MDRKELEKDFFKYERYIYYIIGTNEYHSKMKLKPKVNVFDSKMLGLDLEDLIQEGKKSLWEALLRYGKFPERTNSKENRKLASKSTFIYRHLINSFINISLKCSSKKFKRIDVEINNDIEILDCITPEDIILFKEKYKEELKKENIENLNNDY